LPGVFKGAPGSPGQSEVDMHINSLLAEPKPDRKSRMYHLIYSVLDVYARPMTAREIFKALYGQDEGDLNRVRPRLTEMKNKFIVECGEIKDYITKQKVSLFRIKRPEENDQPELF
jgi:hypothetical protein